MWSGEAIRAQARFKLTGGKFECVKCSRRYNRKENFRRHIRLECEIDPQFQCYLCLKRFKRKEHLFRHMRLHAKPTNGVTS
ncbi:hypothetical protein ILUMI_18370 [Ignelater luminosus]|uniref:C2H2-type domain-containing protein n=1 Tax=Ignelater luminosus TaxID=2038154 RepID=A0A8K0G6Y8_IGNLU|nr:hypothetical protein ILUMI_18370 [Ignelater luminosus]